MYSLYFKKKSCALKLKVDDAIAMLFLSLYAHNVLVFLAHSSFFPPASEVVISRLLSFLIQAKRSDIDNSPVVLPSSSHFPKSTPNSFAVHLSVILSILVVSHAMFRSIGASKPEIHNSISILGHPCHPIHELAISALLHRVSVPVEISIRPLHPCSLLGNRWIWHWRFTGRDFSPLLE